MADLLAQQGQVDQARAIYQRLLDRNANDLRAAQGLRKLDEALHGDTRLQSIKAALLSVLSHIGGEAAALFFGHDGTLIALSCRDAPSERTEKLLRAAVRGTAWHGLLAEDMGVIPGPMSLETRTPPGTIVLWPMDQAGILAIWCNPHEPQGKVRYACRVEQHQWLALKTEISP